MTEAPVFEALPRKLKIESIVVRLLRLPLKEVFETSFGRVDSRLVFLIAIEAEGLTGWGEIVAFEEPLYSFETVHTALHAVRDFLAPALLAAPISGLSEIPSRFARFRGHNMARAGLELACADLSSRMLGQPLWAFLGGSRERVEVGVSLGIQPKVSDLLNRVERYLGLGYRRIKVKIKPGWDIDVVREVRERHPDILLSVDANSAYNLQDSGHLKPLDGLELLMIEQPLHYDDLVDHAKLQSEMATSICLDESINLFRQAEQALDLGSCRIINIKVGRVGGYSGALPIHDLCYSRGIPVWCGGMLESGIGRAHNIALASLPGFSLPGDISASARYFDRDVIEPEVTVASDGTVAVPTGPGLGFEVDTGYIESRTVSRYDIRPD
ncbi:MAG TPA: o-succinylbenzoate synthase [Blastocatellia bacterium]|nr:o-succinylbenzoate synthase [Blastocatellia bacterium]